MNIPTLKPDQIDVKVKKVTKKGVIALLYKTARIDMEVLDEVYGAMSWKCSYKDIKGNLYCTISIWDKEKEQWIDKEDCGIESREDPEGNQKKGEASDAFKRAGYKWGIGRELYTSPFIFINAETYEKDKRFYLKDPFVKYSVKQIGCDEEGKINLLTITDDKKTVYEYGVSNISKNMKPDTQQDRPNPKAEPTKPKANPQIVKIMKKAAAKFGQEKAKECIQEYCANKNIEHVSKITDYKDFEDYINNYDQTDLPEEYA